MFSASRKGYVIIHYIGYKLKQMGIHADKVQGNKDQSITNEANINPNKTESTPPFINSRSEAIAQKELQVLADNSSRVIELKAFKQLAGTNSHSEHVTQLQASVDIRLAQQQKTIQRQVNQTGLPDNLKFGIESLSGYSMDDVKVHYGSDKPAQLQAHAYAQGTDIHVAPGQEQHLPHEAWHVVQQKQGRVKPTIQMKSGLNVNDDTAMEKEADAMGEKAQNLIQDPFFPGFSLGNSEKPLPHQAHEYKKHPVTPSNPVIQGYFSSPGFIGTFITKVQRYVVFNWGYDSMTRKFLKDMDDRYQSDTDEGDLFDFIKSNEFKIDLWELDDFGFKDKGEPLPEDSNIEAIDLEGVIEDEIGIPAPLLRGLVWNLHGFTNVISGNDTDKLKVTGGKRHATRQGMVQDLVSQIGEIDTSGIEKNQESTLDGLLKEVKEEDLADLLNIPLTESKKKKIIKYISKNKKLVKGFAIKIDGSKKFKVNQDQKKELIEALITSQNEYDEDSTEYNEIDDLINHLQAGEILGKFVGVPNYVSNLLKSFQKTNVPGPGEGSLIPLIDKVKQLRSIVKALSVFQHGVDKKASPLQKAFHELDIALNALINRNKKKTYLTDNQNMAVYLDKELNKYGIVSYITSLLVDKRLDLDFMLLNEMNRGILAFTNEVESATNDTYKVESGPQMAAMTQEDKRSQREYYPLVYNAEKFDYIRVFYVGVKEEGLSTGETDSKKEISWMKPENKQKKNKQKEDESNSVNDYLDYRPLIVHVIKRKMNEIQIDEDDNPEIWLVAVHTTPYGSEFDRKNIYNELEEPLKYLQQQAEKKNATLIIGGDYYIAAEALIDSPPNSMLEATTLEERKTKDDFKETSGNQNEIRNLRSQKGKTYNFTKRLSGDEDPLSGKKSSTGIDLQDIRSITGTNRNSQGLQSADYFIVPYKERDRVLVGLIDPETGTIVELETEDQQISRHDFRYSDHVISAIEVYDTQKHKEKARVNRKLNNKEISELYQEDLKNLHETDSKSKGYSLGDYEPRPGISSLITTFLHQIWMLIQQQKPWVNETLIVESSDMDQKAIPEQYQKLLSEIEKTREMLKGKIYQPDTHNEALSNLLEKVKEIKNESILEYATLVQDLMTNYLEQDKSTVREGTSKEASSPSLHQELASSKKHWGFEMNYPESEELPFLLKASFNEDLIIHNKVKATCDADVLAYVLNNFDAEVYKDFIRIMFESPTDIDDPEVLKELTKIGFKLIVYDICFFKELGEYMVNSFKHAYGDGENIIRILNISSGTLKTEIDYFGYYLVGDLQKPKSKSDRLDKESEVSLEMSKSEKTSFVPHELLPSLLGDNKKNQSFDESSDNLSQFGQSVDESFAERLNLQIESAQDTVQKQSEVKTIETTKKVFQQEENLGTNDYLVAYFYLRSTQNELANSILKDLIEVVIPRVRLFHTWEVEVEQAQTEWAMHQLADRGVIWMQEMELRTRLAEKWCDKYKFRIKELDSSQKKIIQDALNAEKKAKQEAKEIEMTRSLFMAGKDLTDGNCLFAALIYDNRNVSLQLANEIRALTIEQLKEEDVINTPFNELRPFNGNLRARMLYEQMRSEGITIQKYREYMGISGVWGGDPEIRAFSRIYSDLTIYIMEPGTIGFRAIENGENYATQNGNTVIEDILRGSAIAIYSSGGHYRRLLPK